MIIKEKLIVDERCCICEALIPEGATVLRDVITTNIICVICLLAIAEVKV